MEQMHLQLDSDSRMDRQLLEIPEAKQVCLECGGFQQRQQEKKGHLSGAEEGRQQHNVVEAHCHVVDKDKLILSRYVAESIESDTVSQ